MTRLVAVLATMTLAGCSTAGMRPGGATDQTIPTGAGQPAPGAAVPASRMLLAQGRADRDAGRYAQATTTIERALRIDPNDPELWLELGEIKLEEGDPDQAREMGRKALTLAAGDRAIEARANRLIR
jgi:Flp pilus assembly protein TadD